jgi:hypothetical protein
VMIPKGYLVKSSRTECTTYPYPGGFEQALAGNELASRMSSTRHEKIVRIILSIAISFSSATDRNQQGPEND